MDLPRWSTVTWASTIECAGHVDCLWPLQAWSHRANTMYPYIWHEGGLKDTRHFAQGVDDRAILQATPCQTGHVVSTTEVNADADIQGSGKAQVVRASEIPRLARWAASMLMGSLLGVSHCAGSTSSNTAGTHSGRRARFAYTGRCNPRHNGGPRPAQSPTARTAAAAAAMAAVRRTAGSNPGSVWLPDGVVLFPAVQLRGLSHVCERIPA